ncbi:MAG: hypothetical protein ACK5AZ_00105 [Bryobacteraceae bacterium]
MTSLNPGDYRIEASKEAFEALIRRDLTVTTGQTVAVESVLSVGAAN